MRHTWVGLSGLVGTVWTPTARPSLRTIFSTFVLHARNRFSWFLMVEWMYACAESLRLPVCTFISKHQPDQGRNVDM